MSLRVLIVVCCFLSIQGQIKFSNNGPDNRCTTPNRKPGRCVPLARCPTLYNAFTRNRAKEPRVKKYLERSLCYYNVQDPVVCCENDAGPCTTPEDKIGACVPLHRCDPVINYLSKKPLFSEDKVKYVKTSECIYDKAQDRGDSPRICCPIFHQNITGLPADFVGPTIVTTTKTPVTSTNKPTTKAPVTTTKKPPVVPKVPLPVPGEENGQCGAESIHDRIIGGNKSDIYEYPWMALIRMGNGEFPCGGSLIHPRYVLTAAHCVTGPKVAAKQNVASVRLGEWDVDSEVDCVFRDEGYEDCSEPPKDFEIEEIIAHPGFSVSRLQDDIALIRLKTEAPWTDFIRPICLPTKHIDISGGNFSVAGWGATENDFKSNFKLFVNQLPLYNKDRCSELYSKARINLTPGQICVGGVEAKDSCSGDSGGPLMLHEKIPGVGSLRYQVGIVSFGPTVCGLANRPAVYTYVEHYMDWIYQNMRV